MKNLAILIIFTFTIQWILGAPCTYDYPPTQVEVITDVCLPLSCTSQFLELNVHHIKINNPTVHYSEIDKCVQASFELVKQDNNPMDNIPTIECFQMVLYDMDRSNGGALDTYVPHVNRLIYHDVPDEQNTVNFRFPAEKIIEYCELTDRAQQKYNCTHLIKYNIRHANTEFYSVEFEYTIIIGDATSQVTFENINKTGDDSKENDAGLLTIPCSLTRWNEAYDSEITDPQEAQVGIGEKVYVTLKAEQDIIQRYIKFKFKSARFYYSSLNVPVVPEQITQINHDNEDIFELRLTFKTVLPGNLALEVIGQVEGKRIRFLTEDINRIGKGQVDLVVTNNRVENVQGKQNQKIRNEVNQDENQDNLTIIIIVLVCIIVIMLPWAIVFSIMRYKNLKKSQKIYDENSYNSDISEIQSQNTIIQRDDQQTNYKNRELSVIV